MIKVIASDMDGTLLCDDHRIAPDTIAAVKEACAAGIRFMVATGKNQPHRKEAIHENDRTGTTHQNPASEKNVPDKGAKRET